MVFNEDLVMATNTTYLGLYEPEVTAFALTYNQIIGLLI